MICPVCGAQMKDVTQAWHTFSEAEGAEYLSSYVTIWRCPTCGALAGAGEDGLEWVMEREEAAAE